MCSETTACSAKVAASAYPMLRQPMDAYGNSITYYYYSKGNNPMCNEPSLPVTNQLKDLELSPDDKLLRKYNMRYSPDSDWQHGAQSWLMQKLLDEHRGELLVDLHKLEAAKKKEAK